MSKHRHSHTRIHDAGPNAPEAHYSPASVEGRANISLNFEGAHVVHSAWEDGWVVTKVESMENARGVVFLSPARAKALAESILAALASNGAEAAYAEESAHDRATRASAVV